MTIYPFLSNYVNISYYFINYEVKCLSKKKNCKNKDKIMIESILSYKKVIQDIKNHQPL